MPDHDQPRHVSDAEWQRLKREAREHAHLDSTGRTPDDTRQQDPDGSAR